MRILTACVSALALAASVPALSQGNSGGQGGGPKAERGQGGGGGPAMRGNQGNRGNADRGNRGGGPQANRGDRGGGPAARGNSGNRGGGPPAGRGNRGNADAGQGNRGGGQRADRRPGNADARGRGQGNRPVQAQARRQGPDQANRGGGNVRDFADARDRNMRVAADRAANRQRLAELRDRPGRARGRDDGFDVDFYRERRWTDDIFRDRLGRIRNYQRAAWQDRFCPPGLSNKNELCMPPGQYRKLYDVGSRFDRSGFGLPDWYRNSYGRDPFYGMLGNMFDYRYANGYAYRLDPETQLIAGLLPILGGALGIGQPLPTGYDVYNLPYQYRSVYPDADYNYRYGDGAIYRVDPRSSRILGISELLAPQFVVGQPLPSGYGAYNVPYGYRGTYYDTDDYLYRYNNGRIYQVDPETRLILAAIDLLV